MLFADYNSGYDPVLMRYLITQTAFYVLLTVLVNLTF